MYRVTAVASAVTPIRVGGLCNVRPFDDAQEAFERSEHGMPSARRWGRCVRWADPAKHQLFAFHVDLFALEAGIEPDASENTVFSVVAPPRSVLVSGHRQCCPDNLLDICKGHGDELFVLRFKELP